MASTGVASSSSSQHRLHERFGFENDEEVSSPLDAAIGADHGMPDSPELEEEERENETQAQLHTITSHDGERDLEKGIPPRISHTSTQEHESPNDASSSGHSSTSSPTATPTPSSPPADPNIVTWEGPEDPENPKNWPFKKKWAVTITVSFFTLMSPVGSSMLAPALPAISQELHMQNGSVLQEMSLSIFVLAYAIGPLFLGPLSEIMGRTIILQLSNILYLVFTIACALSKTSTQLLVFRFLTGLGGSAPLAIGGGTMSDLFIAEERGLATSLYTLAPLTGPAIGPIAGAWIAERTSWRWVFYSAAIADGLVQVAGFIFLRETYAPKILADKAQRLRKETGNPNLRTAFERPDRTTASVIRHGMMRSLTILATEPIVQILASYMAVLYGMMYLTLTTFPTVWTDNYHESAGVGGLNYLSLGIGFTCGTQLGARVLDRVYIKLKKQNGGVGTPEMRMPLMMGTSLCVPIGMLIYGWTADKHVFWLVPDIGIGIFAFGVIGSFLSIQTYVIDNFTLHAASALAAAASARSLAGFGFPLFAGTMFKHLGIGWGNTLLAGIAILFLPSPYLFYKYGPYIRSKSRFARHQAIKAAAADAAAKSGAATPATGGNGNTPRPGAATPVIVPEDQEKEREKDEKRSSVRKSEGDRDGIEIDDSAQNEKTESRTATTTTR